MTYHLRDLSFVPAKREGLYADVDKCCYVQKCGKADLADQYQPTGFTKLSPYFVYHKRAATGGIDITVYKLHRCFTEKLWCKQIIFNPSSIVRSRITANSQYVFVPTEQGIKILSLDHGEQVKEISLWNTVRVGRWWDSNYAISHKYLAVLRPLYSLNARGQKELIRFDLETFEVRSQKLNCGSMFTFSGELVGLTANVSKKTNKIPHKEPPLSILNLSTVDSLENAFHQRRVISYEGLVYDSLSFQEAGKGFGLICYQSSSSLGSSGQVIFMSWKSKTLAPALVTFKNKLGFTH